MELVPFQFYKNWNASRNEPLRCFVTNNIGAGHSVLLLTNYLKNILSEARVAKTLNPGSMNKFLALFCFNNLLCLNRSKDLTCLLLRFLFVCASYQISPGDCRFVTQLHSWIRLEVVFSPFDSVNDSVVFWNFRWSSCTLSEGFLYSLGSLSG